jgi:hypothetical protein
VNNPDQQDRIHFKIKGLGSIHFSISGGSHPVRTLLIRQALFKNPCALSLSKWVRILVLRQAQHERKSSLIRAGLIGAWLESIPAFNLVSLNSTGAGARNIIHLHLEVHGRAEIFIFP